ncbi:MAG: DUF1844 domain-containing protein [Candidatus Aceula meridiana]|nr:DUF1844 domain-containing protein [Candidatus Aceula meridiana]
MTDAQTEDKRQDLPKVDFLAYITSLAFQAMVFLGEVPSPVTNKIEKNLPQAKFLIDTLVLIREKTTGNLNEQEDKLLSTSVYELQMKYAALTKEGSRA